MIKYINKRDFETRKIIKKKNLNSNSPYVHNNEKPQA